MDLLTEFLAHFGIVTKAEPRQLLGAVAAAYSRLPYENITKIIKRAEVGSNEKARRYPEEVIRNHIDWGAGGTCFSLTAALMQLVRSLGWRAEYILADRRYGPDTHCALMVWIEDVPHLLDPGFLIVDPVPLNSQTEHILETGCNRLILSSDSVKNKIELSTLRKGTETYRLTYKIAPVDPGEFYKAWDASFEWEMMRYPLLTRAEDSRQIYMRGSMLQVSDADSVDRREISGDELIARISSTFKMDAALVERAVSILKSRGEIHGKASRG
jgi:arylamine N-acetyltransferase